MLFSGSWSFWDIGIFEEVLLSLLQILALSKKIHSNVIPVLSKVFLQDEPFSLGLVSASEQLQRFTFFPKK